MIKKLIKTRELIRPRDTYNHRAESRKPQISLSGNYLAEAGFNPGVICYVTVTPETIMITVHRPTVQTANNLDELKSIFKTLGIPTERKSPR